MRTEADQDSSRPAAHSAPVSCGTCVAKHGRPRLPIFLQDAGLDRQAPAQGYPAPSAGYEPHSLDHQSRLVCQGSHSLCRDRYAARRLAAVSRCCPTRRRPASCHAHWPDKWSQIAECLSDLPADSSWFRAFRGLLGYYRPLCRWPLFYNTRRFAKRSIQGLPIPLDALEVVISLKKHRPELGKHSVPDPSRETQMAGGARTELLGHMLPRAAAPEHVKYAVQHTPVRYWRPSSRGLPRLPGRQQRLNLCPQLIVNLPDRWHSFFLRFDGRFFHTVTLPTLGGF